MYNKTNWNMIDYMQYSCSLQKTIANDTISCANTYNFTTEYQMPDISINSMVGIYNQLKNNNTNTVSKYIKHYWPGVNQTSCDRNCLNGYINEMVVTI